jgi:hypothetical protein
MRRAAVPDDARKCSRNLHRLSDKALLLLREQRVVAFVGETKFKRIGGFPTVFERRFPIPAEG